LRDEPVTRSGVSVIFANPSRLGKSERCLQLRLQNRGALLGTSLAPYCAAFICDYFTFHSRISLLGRLRYSFSLSCSLPLDSRNAKQLQLHFSRLHKPGCSPLQILPAQHDQLVRCSSNTPYYGVFAVVPDHR